MKVLGLITEYNPFHNGHLYHLRESKRQSGATHTIAVMSGNFLQRGAPALFHKWLRAQMAVEAGVDLVIELPTPYACATAELFAFGGVKLLDALGIVDTLYFGSEAGQLQSLLEIAQLLVNPPPGLNGQIKAGLKKGLSYPAARSQGLIAYLEEQGSFSLEGLQELKDLIKSPNNILAIEYLKALTQLNSPITPGTILRKKAPYHSTELFAQYASATAIRTHLQGGGALDSLRGTMPATSLRLMETAMLAEIGPIYLKDMEQALLVSLRRSDPESLRKVFDVSEGLENRILKGALHQTTLEGLLEACKSKRYPITRLQRIFIHHLLGITRRDMEAFQQGGGPQYIRVLAFNQEGRRLLKAAGNKARLPIITKLSHYTPENPLAQEMLKFDLRATDLYRLFIKNHALATRPLDFTQSPIFIQG